MTLVSGFGRHVEDLLRAAGDLGMNLRALPFPSLVGRVGIGGDPAIVSGDVDLTNMSGVLIRMMPPGSLEQVIYRMDALHLLEREGVALLNAPRAVEISVDKYLSLALLSRAGGPVPATTICETVDDALAAFEHLGRDVIIKPLFGSEGRGLVRVSDRELARRAFQAIAAIGSVLYVQETIRHPGFDYRAFVLGGKVIGAIRRYAPADDWRTNVAVGGRPEAYRLPGSLEALAIAAARAVGAEMAGVDLLDDLDRGITVVLEVNAVPGWKALANSTGIDVAGAILTHLREKSLG